MNTTFQILTLTDLKIINERIRGSGPYTNEISMSDSRNNAVLAPPFLGAKLVAFNKYSNSGDRATRAQIL